MGKRWGSGDSRPSKKHGRPSKPVASRCTARSPRIEATGRGNLLYQGSGRDEINLNSIHNTMKAKLTEDYQGREAGHEVEIVSTGVSNSYAEDAAGQFYVPNEILTTSEPLPEGGEPAPEPEPEVLVPRDEVDDSVENEARQFYADYTELVGGVAYDGKPLPPADEFFEDPKKQKQANAYRGAMGRLFCRALSEVEDLKAQLDALQTDNKEATDESHEGKKKKKDAHSTDDI